MKAGQAVKSLSELDPNESLVIFWWDLDWVNSVLEGNDRNPLTPEQWETIAKLINNEQMDYAAELGDNIANTVLEERDEL